MSFGLIISPGEAIQSSSSIFRKQENKKKNYLLSGELI
jgi:hypothetical protein